MERYGLHYIYDCLNSCLYPCSETDYKNIKSLDKEELYGYINVKSIEPNSKNLLIDSLKKGEKHLSKKMYSYQELCRAEIIYSLANVKQITLEITDECNLKCLYCCYGSLYKKTRKGNTIHQDPKILLERVLTLRKKYKIKSSLRISFYGGEPLLEFEKIQECVTLAHKILPNVTLIFSMTTNGILLNKYIDYLIENDFKLHISIDGNYRNNEYRITKYHKQSYPIVYKNIKKIFQNEPEYFKSNVSFSTVLHDKNNYLDAIEFFSRWGKIPSFSLLSMSNTRGSTIKNIIKRQKHIDKESISLIRKLYPIIYNELFHDRGNMIYGWEDNTGIQSMTLKEIDMSEKWYYPMKSCFLFSTKIFISIEGNIHICEKSSRKYIFGKITPNRLFIFTKKINQYYNQINIVFNTICKKCYMRFSCTKCFFSDSEEILNGNCICNKNNAEYLIKL